MMNSWMTTTRPLAKIPGYITRHITDKTTPTIENSTSNKITVVQNAESDGGVRIRRCKPSDLLNILNFIKQNKQIPWPGLIESKSLSNGLQVFMNDYVSRLVAQGHTMIAEQPSSRSRRSTVLGIALSSMYSPWDAKLIEKWTKCVMCLKCQRLMGFTAHCLQAPNLHEKYNVMRVMQVIPIVSPNEPRHSDIITLLAESVLARGRDVGTSIVRIDATHPNVSKQLDKMHMNKEWELSYAVLPEVKDVKIENAIATNVEDPNNQSIDTIPDSETNTISVYTVNAQSFIPKSFTHIPRKTDDGSKD